ncbi:sugar phosphate nucleotidyltransferase [Allomuricauda sp. SCSIO 65647]|uniref:sugar phosphate nucleotidyltransferase n=1 Tax=Allomuricauda sp. SCSIO 65647 TaxID=2908843 RepID=UPI001F1EAB5C|nr:sugar phosphate nucleotidyltransferase [Muricauda sp. SCSIO 65647]UJH68109.1 NTP transferase domain-containing protein [Muricauda sp. SCSIO 65647]
MMTNDSLVIMAGGASSRMKRSLETAELDDLVKNAALKLHKSLIPLGKSGKPLLYYLFKNAAKAGYSNVYLITAKENEGFKQFLAENEIPQLNVRFAIQHIPKGREKPLGTADALLQCLDQHPKLQESSFTVCNGDNLYSTEALHILRKKRSVPHATIGYSGSGLGFAKERLAKYAVMAISPDGFLKQIVEKPSLKEMDKYLDVFGELRISMNIFSFSGAEIYPFLVHCPINPDRGEKELPEAVRNVVARHSKSLICYSRSERLPDLTDANDLKDFYL